MIKTSLAVGRLAQVPSTAAPWLQQVDLAYVTDMNICLWALPSLLLTAALRMKAQPQEPQLHSHKVHVCTLGLMQVLDHYKARVANISAERPKEDVAAQIRNAL